MKKLLIYVLCICFFVLPIPALAQDNIKIILNDKELTFDVPPQTINDRVLVPIRSIFEALGATVYWDEKTQSIISQRGNIKLELQIGKTKAKRNDQEIELEQPPLIINDRTLVPLRFISESFDAQVQWDEKTTTVKIFIDAPKNTILDTSKIDFCKLKKKYISESGISVTVTNIKKTEASGSISYTVTYKLENETKDKKIIEGTFKMFFETGDPESQNGFFTTLFPDESVDRTCTFKLLKSQKPLYIEYDSNSFSNTTQEETLKWKIE